MALSESLRQGHSCLPLNVIANVYWGRASDSDNIITHQGYLFPAEQCLTELLTQIKQGALTSQSHQHPVVFWNNCLYLRRYFCFEQELAAFIKPRLTLNNNVDVSVIQNCLAKVFSEDDFSAKSEAELDWQMLSVANALNKKFTIVAGGPGTGKTYTVTKILAALIIQQQAQIKSISAQDNLNIAMVAPTGKAAQRLSESITNAIHQFEGQIANSVLSNIPTEALTIHRLLGVIPQSLQFKHGNHNKLAIDVLLIDEVSMVDLALMTRVFRALPAQCQVILLGDADQLPSVLAGSLLSELAPRPHGGYSDENISYLQAVTKQTALKNSKNKKLSTKVNNHDHLTILQKSRRFDGKGGIGLLASAVISGRSEQSWQLLVDNITPQISRASLNIDEALAGFVQQYYLPLLSQADLDAAFVLLSQFRILCVTRQGETGVESINDKIIKQLHGDHHFINQEHCYHGQPIMINENNYALSLYNGDIGIIWRNEHGHLMAFFENTRKDNDERPYRSFMLSQLPPYETVYAMTIHKTQGSEFDHVLMMLPEQSDHQLLSRELLYTGITRAKHQLTVFSKSNVWQQGVNKQVKRYANLGYRLFKAQ